MQWLILFTSLYLVTTALWVGKTMLQYGEMTIRIDGHRLTMESGLFSRITCRLSRNKATVLNIKQNPLDKLAHCQTVTLSQAHNASTARCEAENCYTGGSGTAGDESATRIRDMMIDRYL